MTEENEMTEPVKAESTDHAVAPARTRGGSTRSRKVRLRTWLDGMPVPARWSLIVGVVVLTLLVAGVVTDIALSAGRIHPGVSVSGVAVGGLTPAEAVVALDSGIRPLLERPVNVSAGSETWELTAEQVAASVDSTSLADAAFGIGRGTGFSGVVGQRIAAWVGRADIGMAVSVDESRVSGFLNDVDAAAGTVPVDASVEVSGTDVRLVPAIAGEGVDRIAARAAIVEAFASEERAVSLDLVGLVPAITDEGARAAFDAATEMVSDDLTLTYDEKKWDVPAKDIGDWLAFRSAGTTGSAEASASVLECYLDSAEVSATVVPLVKEVGKLAKDASFKVSSGKVSIVPAEDGLGLDSEDLAALLMTALQGEGERTVELPMKRVEASISTEDAKGMGISTRLSTYTTSYSASNKPRVNNIHQLADALDGTLIPPGGVFSFNESIGPRTAEKGYQEANAIVNGKLVPQLGGGVCQVGTTIFNTVFFSGLPVVERRNHSLYISHYPKGRDATVSWGGPDFKFRNDTENWVLIATSHSSSTVTVSLYGTETGYDVSYETGPFTNSVAYNVREIKDATLPKGTRVVEEKGVSGRTVVVTRTVKKNGSVIRTDTFKSVYKPSEEVVRVGTKVTTPSTPSTTTP